MDAASCVECWACNNVTNPLHKIIINVQDLEMDVFISHASKDAALAMRIENYLEENGLTVWLDHSEIRLGVLLRKELETAIKYSQVLILLWSEASAKSRWVKAEVLTAFHRNKFILAIARDSAPLPYFLQNTIYLNLRSRNSDWMERLCRAVRESPDKANDLLPMMSSQSLELQQVIQRIAERQMEVTDCLGHQDLAGAKQKQRQTDGVMIAALKTWPQESMVSNLAGYHYKNAYMVKHWAALQAGRPPSDRLIEKAERFFFEALFVTPNDFTALNGLGSLLFLERDIESAEFFIRRAIALAKKNGNDYSAAQHDLAMIVSFKRKK
jgi:tetratricopeptide (TPR) repeat protein